MLINSYLIGIFSSLSATAVTALLVIIFRGRIIYTFRRLYYQLVGIGIDAAYEDVEEFEAELSRLCIISERIYVLSFRGALGCQFLFKNGSKLRGKRIEVLLADPYTEEGIRWIQERENETRALDRNRLEDFESYADTIKKSLGQFQTLDSRFALNLHVYMYRSRAVWAMYIFDDKVAFIGGYTKHNLGSHSTYYKVSGKSLLLDIGIRHYEYLRDVQSQLYMLREPDN